MERGKHRDELQKLSDTRIEDAEVLRRNRRYDAAYYLAGYAVECALKARIVRVLKDCFPPKQSLYIAVDELGDSVQFGLSDITGMSPSSSQFRDLRRAIEAAGAGRVQAAPAAETSQGIAFEDFCLYRWDPDLTWTWAQ
jgi:hypothetical protein